MKKFLILLCAAMLLCSCAFAESGVIDYMDRFEMKCSLPDGYHHTLISMSDLNLEGAIRADSDDPAAPRMTIYISFNESFAAVQNLNDLDEGALDLIRQGFSDENTVAFDMIETDSGIRLLVVRETGDDPDFLDFYTVYHGHEIELTLLAGDSVPDGVLTDAQVENCLKYIRTLEITPMQG